MCLLIDHYKLSIVNSEYTYLKDPYTHLNKNCVFYLYMRQSYGHVGFIYLLKLARPRIGQIESTNTDSHAF